MTRVILSAVPAFAVLLAVGACRFENGPVHAARAAVPDKPETGHGQVAAGPAAPDAAAQPPDAATTPPDASSAAPEDPAAAARLAEALRRPFSASSVDAVEEALTRAGIAVWEDDLQRVRREATGPVSGLRYAHFQAQGMAMELAGGGGTTSETLDALLPTLPVPDGGTLRFTMLLKRWATEGRTFGAGLTRALRAGDDNANAPWPTLTLALFHAEVLLPALAATAAIDAGGAGILGPRTAVDGVAAKDGPDPCGAINDFINDVPEAVESGVRRGLGALRDAAGGGDGSDDEGGGLLGWVIGGVAEAAGFVAGTVVQTAREVLRNVPVARAVRLGADILAGLIDVSSMFSQWTLTVTSSPPSLHRVPGSPDSGTMTLTVVGPADGAAWPEQVSSCAELLGIDLPSLDGADDAPVTWVELAGFRDLAVPTTSDDHVRNGRAEFRFRTTDEGRDVHDAGGEETTDFAVVRAELALPGLQDLARRLGGQLGLRVGAGVANAGAAVAAQAFGPSREGQAEIRSHGGGPAAIEMDVGTYSLSAVSCSGPLGPWEGTLTIRDPALGTGSTALSWTFDSASRQASIAWSVATAGSMLTENIRAQETWTLSGETVEARGSYHSDFVPHYPGPPPPPVDGARREDYRILRGPRPECPAP